MCISVTFTHKRSIHKKNSELHKSSNKTIKINSYIYRMNARSDDESEIWRSMKSMFYIHYNKMYWIILVSFRRLISKPSNLISRRSDLKVQTEFNEVSTHRESCPSWKAVFVCMYNWHTHGYYIVCKLADYIQPDRYIFYFAPSRIIY